MHPQNIHTENPDSKYSPNVCKRDHSWQIDRTLKRDHSWQILENLALREIGFGWWFVSHLTGSNLATAHLMGSNLIISSSHEIKSGKSAQLIHLRGSNLANQHLMGSALANQLISWDQIWQISSSLWQTTDCLRHVQPSFPLRKNSAKSTNSII